MTEAAFRSWIDKAGAEIPPELAPIVIAEYPEIALAAAAKDAPVKVQRPLSIFGPRLQHHSFIKVFISWSKGFTFETWTGVAAIGPFGFRRIDARPEALAAILLGERAALPDDTAAGYADVFWHALSPLAEPDRDSNPARDGRHTILNIHTLEAIASGGRGGGNPIARDPEAFAKIQAQLAPPSFSSGVLVFGSIDFAGMNGPDAEYDVTRWTCRVHPSSYAIAHEKTHLGRYVATVGRIPVPGRPLMIDGAPRVAPLVRRSDWS